MNAGLPGTGIGGLFYIAGALWMPIHGVYGRLTGAERAPSWQRIGTLWSIAGGILLGLWATGWVAGYLIALMAAPQIAAEPGLAPTAAPVASVVRWAAVVGSMGILGGVLALVQLLRVFVPRPRPLEETDFPPHRPLPFRARRVTRSPRRVREVA